MSLSRCLTLAALILVAIPAPCENKKQQEVRALIDHAKQLSDIRTDGSPAFHLKIGFKVLNKGSAPIEGTYTEVWASREKWRQETNAGNFKRIAVANGEKIWTSASETGTPPALEAIGLRMNGPKYIPGFWRNDRTEDRDIGTGHLRCIEFASISQGPRSALCFEQASGLVVMDSVPVAVGDRSVERVCTYSDYQKFGEKMFPRTMKCSDGQMPVLESTLLELSAEPSSDPSLFAPLPGSTASLNCRGVPVPPAPVYTPVPEPVKLGVPRPVILLISVGVDGKPKDLKVVRSVDADYDKAAMDAVGRWRFKPATCDGQPMEVKVNVEVNSIVR